MAVDPILSLYVGVVVAGIAGALSAYMGWNSSNEPFNARKFINGLITGVIGGLVVLAASAVALQGITTETELFVMLLTIFLSAVGADRLRTDTSKAINNRADQEVPKTTSTPPPP